MMLKPRDTVLTPEDQKVVGSGAPVPPQYSTDTPNQQAVTQAELHQQNVKAANTAEKRKENARRKRLEAKAKSALITNEQPNQINRNKNQSKKKEALERCKAN